MGNLSYFIHEALIGIRRHIPTTVGTIITMFLSLMAIGAFIVGGSVVDRVLSSVEDQISITVYLSDEADQGKVDEMKNYISGLEGVQSVEYTSKDQALEDFKNTMSNDEITNQFGDSNPLPASLDVQLSDSQDVGQIVDQIASNSELLAAICDAPDDPTSSIAYGQQVVDRLFSVTNTIRFIGYVVIALMVFIAVVFINNTVRLAIMSRRKEISIERLTGASNSFIRAPFFIESIIHSVISVALTVVVLELIRNIALPNISQSLPWLPIDMELMTFIAIYAILLVVGIAIGLLGSAFAMRKYLKV